MALGAKTHGQESQCPALLFSAFDSVIEIILKKNHTYSSWQCHWFLDCLLQQLADLQGYQDNEVLSHTKSQCMSQFHLHSVKHPTKHKVFYNTKIQVN